MKVIITEKPSVARDIARVLGVTKKQVGYFENEQYWVTWAYGHLIQLSDPDHYDPAYQQWQFSNLPIIPSTFHHKVIDSETGKAQFERIKALLNNPASKTVICATDAGREGELIFRLIYQESKCKLPIERLWLSSQTDKAIKDAFNVLQPGTHYDMLYDAARCRSEADWLIGMNATRAYTITHSFGKGVMSVGRVQTPVLKMIVDRYQSNQTFVPTTFYELFIKNQHQNGAYLGKWFDSKTDRFDKKEGADTVQGRLSIGQSGQIVSVTKKKKQEKPPLLFDLTELQKEANKRHRFSADKTLKVMQQLYETHKCLTYPRTSSQYLGQDIVPQLKDRLALIKSVPEYAAIVQDILTAGHPINARIVDDQKVTDHHAIIPTDKPPPLHAFSADEHKIYILVIKRFIAAFLPDCIKNHTEIISQYGQDRFKTTGTIIEEDGWRRVYLKEKDEKKGAKKDSEIILPDVQKGDAVTISELTLNTSQTKAPPLYTEASILAAMETAGKDIEDASCRDAMKELGLGTAATRAQILERLIQVNYIYRDKNKLVPTEKGIYLISIIQDPALLSAELTGEWEKKLRNMVKNDYSREQYMSDIKAMTTHLIQTLSTKMNPHNVPLVKCPKCGGNLSVTARAYSCENWKTKGCDFKIWKTIASRDISIEEVNTLITDNKTPKLSGFKSKAGRSFDTKLTLKEGKVVFEFS